MTLDACRNPTNSLARSTKISSKVGKKVSEASVDDIIIDAERDPSLVVKIPATDRLNIQPLSCRAD